MKRLLTRPRCLLPFALLLAVGLSGCFHGADPDPVETDQVVIPGAWVFEPEVIRVEVNTTVTWTNNGGQEHTVTFDELPFDEEISPGGQTEYTFEEPGTYDYVCRYHLPDMTGVVIVEEDSQSDGAGT